jgi:hypothetical protein
MQLNQIIRYQLNRKQAAAATPVFTGFNVYYVSSRYGNDATALVNNDKKPYKTITAAKALATSADVIYVMEGVYNEGYLFGNYRYWFDYGAEINYSGSGAIFHQYPGQCFVRGFGKFSCTTNAANVINVGNWINCLLDLECESIDSITHGVVLFQNTPSGFPLYKPHRVKAKRAYASAGYAVGFRFNSYAEVEIDEIISDSITDPGLFIGSMNKGLVKNAVITGNNYPAVNFGGAAAEMTIENCEINTTCNDPAGDGIFLDGAINDFYFYNSKITCKNAGAKSINNTAAAMNLHLDNNVSASNDTAIVQPINYVNKDTRIYLSNNEVTIDITGLASFDLAPYQNKEVIRLTSANPAETITDILNAPVHHNVKILPAAGLALTVNSTDPTLAVSTNIVLNPASVILNGTKGDWLELRNSLYGTGNKEVKAINY